MSVIRPIYMERFETFINGKRLMRGPNNELLVAARSMPIVHQPREAQYHEHR